MNIYYIKLDELYEYYKTLFYFFKLEHSLILAKHNV